MSLFYSAATGGFYDDSLHDTLPADAVEVDEQTYRTLLAGRSAGHPISADSAGRPVLGERPGQTLEQSCAALKAAVQLRLDEAAQAAGYDDIKSAVSYADEPAVRQYQADGLRLRAWRSRVWAFALPVINSVAAGELAPDAASAQLAALPELDSPTTTTTEN
ncbi:hypothetical protein [Rubrivivax gelatinosus]|uniref:Phage tail protein n=1 Tax=Rubrivivax gelatinosus TaxID=28068 RepID=A0A4R2MGV0_RUBGE|nr:hypothetical protein [Rubrivivax gelatinosus]MBK1686206.1 hypothetical protein [Rubrivivax gelatinosus]TCP05701.1 hypothetical protein EV684_101575 [Rubrivivax gelatinosus]